MPHRRFPSARPGRRAFLAGSAALALAAAAGCNTRGPGSGAGRDETAATLALVNRLRAEKGLPALSADPAARRAALEQARRMAASGRMEHVIGIGASFPARMKSMGVTLPAAENIAAGQDSAAKAFDAWYRSPKHLENMLGAHYRGLGVAVVSDPASGNRPYWAMVLAG
ncbi:CAP domain-containing protein [Shinella daejeonensis]|uniref:CAP domain-containing protein n=1 Tax=Shinella daejeonensis TaxID=659017 RepID=UPI0020C82EEE|nr:CAP domain-containing protein [Shinella daejeonensis]MCP8896279.1 CAP domain-containing protein [Shinella daejeonensis]